jgi:hypothetical protein
MMHHPLVLDIRLYDMYELLMMTMTKMTIIMPYFLLLMLLLKRLMWGLISLQPLPFWLMACYALVASQVTMLMDDSKMS